MEKKYEIINENKTSKLIIKNIILEDEGVYGVEINGSSASANLAVDG